MTSEMPRLAVLGLGTMGRAMAGSALRGGLPTVVWNRRPGAAAGLEEQGAEVARSVDDAVGQADVVITMVTDAAAVTAIATEEGMLAALPIGAVWAQMSTIGVDGTERIAALVGDERPDVDLVDAPVSGSKVPAEQGTLLIFASGSDEARQRVAPVFEAIGQRTVWLGQVGAGSRMKLVNNVLLAFSAEGIANSIGLAQQLGLETTAVIDAFGDGPLISAWESGKLHRIAQGEFSAEFALALALKDVRLALAAAGSDRFRALAAVADEWSAVVESGLGGEDITVVTRVLGT
jgi:3-hydroxyisobutyrate dehydrogenase